MRWMRAVIVAMVLGDAAAAAVLATRLVLFFLHPFTSGYPAM